MLVCYAKSQTIKAADEGKFMCLKCPIPNFLLHIRTQLQHNHAVCVFTLGRQLTIDKVPEQRAFGK